ncbi:MAG: UTP--glucose-1-phosphate uridylyltransferase GalU [Proteobacteria bacterium]|nr:UTP--glucose-1-phosphate uridylyltransferase GalU [Pseudomonadota bacterium]
MTYKIRKAVFPVAGLGSRFLPATKANPKEMMPVVDKPLIQYAVEEAAAAGITDMIFITGRNKRAIEDHFDKAHELEAELQAKQKDSLLRLVQTVLPDKCRCIYIRQSEPLGLGHAVLCARPVVGDEPFAVLLADDLIDADPPAMAQMVAQFERSGSSVIGVEDVPRVRTGSYGIVSISASDGPVSRIDGIVEKPAPEDAPSTLGVVGRYILTAGVFEHLAGLAPGRGGEIQLTDGIAALLKHEKVVAMRIPGRRFDCGSKLGYLQASVEYGLRHPELGAAFRQYLEARQR